MKKVICLLFAIFSMYIIILGPVNVHAADTINHLEVDTNYNILSLKETYSSDYKIGVSIPEDGRIKVWIKEYVHDSYDSLGIPRKESGSYCTKSWIRNVESMHSGWITVKKGEFVGYINIDGYYSNYDGTVYIEFQSLDQYVGEKENNDTFAEANEIDFDVEYQGDYSSYKSGYKESDYYKFILMQPGKIEINLADISGKTGHLEYELYETDANGNYNQIKLTEEYGELPSGKDVLRLPAGSYYINVIANCNDVSEYRLKVNCNYEDETLYEQEYNNVKRYANDIVAGEKYVGNLNNIDDMDWFCINIPVKSKFSASLWIPEQLGDKLLSITLFDENLNLIAEAKSTNNKYLVTSEKIVPSGQYYIRVKNIGGMSNLYDYRVRTNVKCVTHRLESKIIRKADYGVSGEKEVRCNVCTYKETIKIPALVVKPVTDLRAKLVKNTSINVSWSKTKGADAYSVYMRKGNGNYYKKITTSKNTYKASKLTQGAKYTFAIVPCVKVNDKYKELNSSIKEVSKFTLAKVKDVSIKKSSNSKVTIKWKGIQGETGYQIARSKSKNGTYKVISTVKQPSYKWPSTTLKVKKNTSYYYKVRAYVKVGNAKIYGPWSDKKMYKVK